MKWGCSAALLVLAACGGDGGSGARDAGGDPEDGGTTGCATDADCDDGIFCNGTETCSGGACGPGAPIDCNDGIGCTTDACSETTRSCTHAGPDADGDGHGDASCTDADDMPVGDDCDDADARRYPGNAEICDTHDEDCNGETFGFTDADGDGAGSSACCNGASCGPDCDDANEMISPGAPDGPPGACDGLDNDCDGTEDEGCPCVEGMDRPCGAEMPVGICRPGTQLCIGGAWTSTCTGEVTAAPEVCNGLDDDCDATTDEGVTRRFYRDVDLDGYGIAAETMDACSAPTGYAPNPDDCDDARAGVNPSSVEVCNGIDDDCSGVADEGLVRTFYQDMDGDGFGNPAVSMRVCDAPDGHVTSPTDCDDIRAAVNPAASETCNGRDDDCDGTMDLGCACTIGMTRMCGSTDVGECAIGAQRCVDGIWGECVGDVEPRPELCNGLDDDCDGSSDEAPFACRLGETMAGCTTACGSTGTRVCRADCSAFEQCRTSGEGATFPGTCNACDDDGDGAVDDGFACIRDRPEACLTACGTFGQRVCNAMCTGYTTAMPECRAVAETCNYCDDDGDGTFEDDRGLVIESRRREPPDCALPGEFLLRAGARCTNTCRGFPCPPEGTDFYADLTQPGAVNAIGGVWWARPLSMGWGPVRFRVRVAVTDAAGTATPWSAWAAVISTTPPPATLTLSGPAVPVEVARMRGLSVESHFNRSPADPTDMVRLRPLIGMDTAGVISEQPIAPTVMGEFDTVDATTDRRVIQALVIEYTPDDPTTATIEERVDVRTEADRFSGGESILGWTPMAGRPAPNLLARGPQLWFGVVGTGLPGGASTTGIQVHTGWREDFSGTIGDPMTRTYSWMLVEDVCNDD